MEIERLDGRQRLIFKILDLALPALPVLRVQGFIKSHVNYPRNDSCRIRLHGMPRGHPSADILPGHFRRRLTGFGCGRGVLGGHKNRRVGVGLAKIVADYRCSLIFNSERQVGCFEPCRLMSDKTSAQMPG